MKIAFKKMRIFIFKSRAATNTLDLYLNIVEREESSRKPNGKAAIVVANNMNKTPPLRQLRSFSKFKTIESKLISHTKLK